MKMRLADVKVQLALTADSSLEHSISVVIVSN